MSQDCQRFQDLLPLYAFEALDEAEALEVQHHIQHCEACRSATRDYRKIFWALRIASAPEPTPEQIERVSAGVQRGIRRHRIATFAFRAAAVLAAAACLVLVLRLAWPGSRSVPPPFEQPVAEDGVREAQGIPAEQLGTASREPTEALTPPEAAAEQKAVPALPAPRPRTPDEEWGEVAKTRTAFWALKSRKPAPEAQASADQAGPEEWLAGVQEILDRALVVASSQELRSRLEAQRIVFQCYKELGERENEETAFYKYLELVEESGGKDKANKALCSYANRKFIEGNYLAAIGYYDALLAREPDEDTVLHIHYQVAGLHAGQRRPDQALEELEWIIKRGKGTPYAAIACRKSAEILANMKRYEKALEVLDLLEKELACSDADRQHAIIKRGTVYVMSRNHAKAASYFHRVQKEYPENKAIVRAARGYLAFLQSSGLDAIEP